MALLIELHWYHFRNDISDGLSFESFLEASGNRGVVSLHHSCVIDFFWISSFSWDCYSVSASVASALRTSVSVSESRYLSLVWTPYFCVSDTRVPLFGASTLFASRFLVSPSAPLFRPSVSTANSAPAWVWFGSASSTAWLLSIS